MKKTKSSVTGKTFGHDKFLSMDEYVAFVNFNMRYFRKGKTAKSDEIAMRVNVPFSIK